MLQLSETDSKGQKTREKERQKFESIVNEYAEYLEKNRTESGNGIVKETYGSRETEEKAKDYFEQSYETYRDESGKIQHRNECYHVRGKAA